MSKPDSFTSKNEVSRYNSPRGDHTGMEQDEDGDYVRWEDYRRLERERDYFWDEAMKASERERRATVDVDDGARYRWLKTHHLQLGPDCWIRTGDDLDDAINAEMRNSE